MNNNYLGTPLSPEEFQRQLAGGSTNQSAAPDAAMFSTTTGQGSRNDVPMTAAPDIMPANDSFGSLLPQNPHQHSRRSSVPQPFTGAPLGHSDSDRRLSLLDYPSTTNDVFPSGPFGTLSGSSNEMLAMFGSMGDISQSGPFASSAMMAMSDPTNLTGLSSDMMAFSHLSMGQMASNPNSMDLFDPTGLGNQMVSGSVNPEFPVDMNIEDAPFGISGGDEMMMVDPAPFGPAVPTSGASKPSLSINPSLGAFGPSLPPRMATDVSSPVAGPSSSLTASQTTPLTGARPAVAPSVSGNSTPVNAPTPAFNAPTPGSMTSPLVTGKPEKNIYSRSGFDMMRALWYVVSRKNPEVQLGAVDMSCAFVVCDVTLNDCPIIYVSDNFQNLTGYSRHEIVGKNCRFLQSPDGLVEAGSQREFVENHAVYRLKRKISEGREVQQSLINYRKGGKPFLNLLTMIPIPWDSDEIRYFIGFQIDLVECPDAITGNDTGGSMQVNYIHSELEQYIWNPPNQWAQESGQTLGIEEVSTLLQQFNPAGPHSEWHKQSWDKMLLENTDDVVHVLSLKGLFLYLSPSCKRVLEWDTPELVGTSLADICHPSDIIPATRELKDTGAGGTIDIAFRIRRKHSGYMWFESHGSLFVEQGKGRKCVILVGRKRPIYNLSRAALEEHGGVGDSEIWTKLSTSGMFLFVSSHIRSLLDLQPQNLVGTSMQDLMRRDSRAEFGRSIEKARQGKIATCKHEVHNKRGQVLQAETALFPGDVPVGQKPTFILAKTRLLKSSSRSHGSGSKSTAASVVSLASEEHTITGGTAGRSSLDGAALVGPLGLGRDDGNIFGEFGTTKTSSWQYELRQMEKDNRKMAEDLALLLSNKKKRKRRKGGGNAVRDCANCHTRNTPEWRRGPSGNRDLCNSCGLRWAKQSGKVSPRNSSRGGNGDSLSKQSASPLHSSPLHRETVGDGSVPGPRSADGASNRSSANATAASDATPAALTPTAGQAMSPNTGHGHTHATGGVNPPQSQPLLEGGSGLGGSGMKMEAISEEREAGA